ncbi:MAG: hypothetical protein NZZ60_01515 [Bacteroidia bacterium]|nr:hypothetical protein [Bacteroidia bacterium]MCX7651612.1 hypothetical protein [Bacteroidia bacterium]MDW8417303.1 hypothetical protein [Bacteroidia bacterium]
MPTAISDKLLQAYSQPLKIYNLPFATLSEVLNCAPYVWLQFLRHLGCIYCKGLVQDIRTFINRWNGETRPKLIFIHPNTYEEGVAFFQKFYPEAAFIADPELHLYKLFQVPRASPWRQLKLGNLLRFWTLTRRGLSNDRPKADPWILHATFLFRQGKLVWSYYAKSFSDVPDWKRLV